MRIVTPLALILLVGCSADGTSTHISPAPGSSGPSASATPTATATPAAPATANVPPQGSQTASGSCGATQVFKGGTLPYWATVNAPSGLPYVVASPGIAIGYLFTDPLTAGPSASNKILWYVWTAREGPLSAEGHPVGGSGATATFSKADDSGPGEIYPTAPTAASSGCWHFRLTWQGGGARNQAGVDLLFK